MMYWSFLAMLKSPYRVLGPVAPRPPRPAPARREQRRGNDRHRCRFLGTKPAEKVRMPSTDVPPRPPEPARRGGGEFNLAPDRAAYRFRRLQHRRKVPPSRHRPTPRPAARHSFGPASISRVLVLPHRGPERASPFRAAGWRSILRGLEQGGSDETRTRRRRGPDCAVGYHLGARRRRRSRSRASGRFSRSVDDGEPSCSARAMPRH